MIDTIRESFFGQCCRLVTGGRVFQYPEEVDSSLCHRYVNEEKSTNMGLHGKTGSPETNSSSSTDNIDARSNSQDALREKGRRYVDPEKGKDVHIVDWYGPDDPANPQNWSRPKKFFVTFEICFLTFSVYIGSAIFSSSITDVETVFGVSQVAATLGLTLFVAGYAVGPMIWAPLSEIPQIGRNPVYIITLALFVVLQVPTALAVNFGMLLAFRFLTGFIGSPSLATGGASIGDMYTPAKRTYGLAVWGIGAVCGPTVGPLVGGFAVEAKGWNWAIWELLWLSGFCLVVLVFFLPETSSANILYRRTQRLRKLTGNTKLISEPELIGQDMTGKDILTMTLIRPFSLLFTEPIVFALDMYIALVYGLLYIWFESFPIVFVEMYQFSLGTLGLAYIGLLVGIFVVAPPLFWYQHRYIEPKFNDNGELVPEWRLPPAFVGAFALPICLFWFGWTSQPQIHWIVPIIGTAWFSVGAFLLFNSVLNYLSDAYPEYAASVLAGNDFLRSMVGAGFPLFANAMYTKLGVGWASSLLGFLSIVFIPIPFVLFKYGHWLRMKSKHARHDF
ncbi:benomyl/methotrexate resistance protein [Cryphonectria parasitica EP155]|uniref:Benomyl/methotrexate resistance protein n=1 Tax=Cryphonectria parasitica (strain ATCC 38755 / EP155) TaxID=660469 RepID=A0A9P4XZB2_CRYP1|nr:benomyl/methotrexate resistance protein [Cryphonectria parasitica EP155]KAF3764107.1 benomyl/methotrexate resistance protein [Cryphonectria parasitica EP155]